MIKQEMEHVIGNENCTKGDVEGLFGFWNLAISLSWCL
jgi:hypothetical protein